MKTIVIRPSERPQVLDQGKLSYDKIKAERIAPDFPGSHSNADSYGQIIVVKSDGTEVFAASIESVVASDAEGDISRVSISFGEPKVIRSEDIPTEVSGISWNQQNLRYHEVEQLF